MYGRKDWVRIPALTSPAQPQPRLDLQESSTCNLLKPDARGRANAAPRCRKEYSATNLEISRRYKLRQEKSSLLISNFSVMVLTGCPDGSAQVTFSFRLKNKARLRHSKGVETRPWLVCAPTVTTANHHERTSETRVAHPCRDQRVLHPRKSFTPLVNLGYNPLTRG